MPETIELRFVDDTPAPAGGGGRIGFGSTPPGNPVDIVARGMTQSVMNPNAPMMQRLNQWIKQSTYTPPIADRIMQANRAPDTEADKMRQMRSMLYAGSAAVSGGKSAVGMASAGLSMAESGLLGKGAAAAAGGPAGIAVALGAVALDVASRKLADAFKEVREETERYGRQARGLIDNSPLTIFNEQVERGANVMGKIPIVGQIFAEQIRAVATPLKEFSQTIQSINARGSGLADFDPRIALGKANTEIQQVLQSIEESRRLGGQYGNVMGRSAQIDRQFAQALLPFKEALLKASDKSLTVLQKMLDTFGPKIEGIGDFTSRTVTAVETAFNFLAIQGKRFDPLGLIGKFEKYLADAQRDREQRLNALGGLPMEMLIQQARNQFRLPGEVGDQAPRKDELNLQVPFGIQVPGAVPMGGK